MKRHHSFSFAPVELPQALVQDCDRGYAEAWKHHHSRISLHCLH